MPVLSASVPSTDRLLTPKEVAEVLGVGRDFVYSLMCSNELPSVKIGRMRRVWFSSVRTWVDGHAAAA